MISYIKLGIIRIIKVTLFDIFIEKIHFLALLVLSFWKKNWGFDTNSDLLIPISLQPNGVNFWYFKLRLFGIAEHRVWNISGLRNWVAKIY